METNVQTPKSDDKHQHNDLVTVTYNSEPVTLRGGKWTVTALREKFGVPANEILVQFLNGKFEDKTEGHVEVKQGDIFASRNPQGGASHNV